MAASKRKLWLAALGVVVAAGAAALLIATRSQAPPPAAPAPPVAADPGAVAAQAPPLPGAPPLPTSYNPVAEVDRGESALNVFLRETPDPNWAPLVEQTMRDWMGRDLQN